MKQSFITFSKRLNISANRLFVLTFFICFFVYGYNKILFYRPVGVHQWRNSISAAFALNYYHHGEFFKSRTNALSADDSTSDITVVEFPIVYYFVSVLYKIFGPHEFIFRLINVLIAYLGLFYLFKTALLVVKDKLYALSIPIFVFTSPIYVFYTNNFIPDATCLSVAFVGVYFFFRFFYQRNKKDWFLSMFFLLLAGLIKTPSLIFFFSVGAIGIVDFIFKNRKTQRKATFPSFQIFIITFIAVVLILVTWYTYARIYSDIHGGSVSAVEIRPIWILHSGNIRYIWLKMIERFRGGEYHSPIFLYMTFLMIIMNIIFIKKYFRLFNLFTFLLLFGAISFSLAFFRSMYHHDYYQIGNLIVIPFVYLNLFNMLRHKYPGIFASSKTKIILIACMILLINDCRINMNHRYSLEHYSIRASNEKLIMFGDLEPYLRQLGIKRTDTVYCTPDRSINISLYLCDQKGYTDFGLSQFNFSERIEHMKDRGLQYIIIGDTSSLADITYNKIDLGNKIGQFGNTQIFKVAD